MCLPSTERDIRRAVILIFRYLVPILEGVAPMVTIITLYLAHDANLLEVQRMLRKERVASENIRKRTTRVAVQRALDNLLP